MDISAQLLEAFLVRHAKALFLVDHNKAEVLKLGCLGKDGVCADHDIDIA